MSKRIKTRTLEEYIDVNFEQFTKDVFFSLYEKCEEGFAMSDLSHYSLKDIEKEFKRNQIK